MVKQTTQSNETCKSCCKSWLVIVNISYIVNILMLVFEVYVFQKSIWNKVFISNKGLFDHNIRVTKMLSLKLFLNQIFVFRQNGVCCEVSIKLFCIYVTDISCMLSYSLVNLRDAIKQNWWICLFCNILKCCVLVVLL